MQICATHWEKLRARIETLGISHLVARDDQEAHRQMVEQLRGTYNAKEYDPLMGCNWMICSKALELAGLQLLMAKEDGSPRCPICEAWEHRHDGQPADEADVTVENFERFWIDGPTQAALTEARRLGLVPAEQ